MAAARLVDRIRLLQHVGIYEDIARIAQRGVMDMLFFGDTGGTPEDYGGNHEAPSAMAPNGPAMTWRR